MSVIKQLEELTEDMKSGKIDENKLNKFRLLTIQQMFIDQKVKCGNDLLKLEKANTVSLLDAMATLIFYPQWEPQAHNPKEQ